MYQPAVVLIRTYAVSNQTIAVLHLTRVPSKCFSHESLTNSACPDETKVARNSAIRESSVLCMLSYLHHFNGNKSLIEPVISVPVRD